MKVDLTMRLPSFIWIFLPLLTVLLACNGQKKAVMDESSQESANSPLNFVMQDNYAGAETPVTHVIKSQKELAKFFSGVNRTRKPGIPVPEVDFSKHLVVIYCAGNAGNGTIPTLKVAEATGAEMILEMTNKTADKGKSNTVSPFSLYTLPLTPKTISFRALE